MAKDARPNHFFSIRMSTLDYEHTLYGTTCPGGSLTGTVVRSGGATAIEGPCIVVALALPVALCATAGAER